MNKKEHPSSSIKLPPLSPASPRDGESCSSRHEEFPDTLPACHPIPACKIRRHCPKKCTNKTGLRSSGDLSRGAPPVKIIIQTCQSEAGEAVTKPTWTFGRTFQSPASGGSDYSKSTSSPLSLRRDKMLKRNLVLRQSVKSEMHCVRESQVPDTMSEESFLRCCEWLRGVEACREGGRNMDVSLQPSVKWTL